MNINVNGVSITSNNASDVAQAAKEYVERGRISSVSIDKLRDTQKYNGFIAGANWQASLTAHAPVERELKDAIGKMARCIGALRLEIPDEIWKDVFELWDDLLFKLHGSSIS